MAMGDINTGEKFFKKCAACHSIVKGGKNNIGPALYNVIGRQVGSINDYKYSKALSQYGKEWTFQELNGYLIKPAKWIKGTKMAFAGLRKEKDRASVILYLNQNLIIHCSYRNLPKQYSKIDFCTWTLLMACTQTFDCLLRNTFSSTSVPLGKQ